MKKFEFKSHTIDFDIEGKVFSISDRILFFDHLKKAGTELIEISEKIGEDPTDQKAVIKEATDFLLAKIDDLLGAGTSDQIFENREPEFYDVCDVFNYIREVAEETQKKTISEYQRSEQM